ncbi:hypothetical protein LCGC14_0616820 [marine sediment metagenome]|uniref:Uncharacterized protein n=1 Tax=marine sediment metagenome TaxID=412755 RepID=A0A0F9R629_9ZZZZ
MLLLSVVMEDVNIVGRMDVILPMLSLGVGGGQVRSGKRLIPLPSLPHKIRLE